MTSWLAVVFTLLLCRSTPLPADEALSCNRKELADKFIEFASPSFDYTPAGLQEAFRPYAGIKDCLKRWVVDGGERDGVPLGGNTSRESYRVYALGLLGQLCPKNKEIASWIRSNMHSWPTILQSQAVNTLGEIGDEESFAFLKAEARSLEGQRKEQVWRSLVLLDGQRVAMELESIAPTHDEQIAMGKQLIAFGQPTAVPALQRLKMLVPERAVVYEDHIREIEKAGNGGHDDEN